MRTEGFIDLLYRKSGPFPFGIQIVNDRLDALRFQQSQPRVVKVFSLTSKTFIFIFGAALIY